MALTPQQRRRNRVNALLFASYVSRNKWVPYENAAVHLDFVNERYFWNTQERARGDFSTFTLSGACSIGGRGLVLDGTAGNFAVSIAWSRLNIAAPFAMVATATPTSVAASQLMASMDDTTTNNLMAVGLSSSTPIVLVTTANVSQASVSGGTASANVRQTVGGGYQTNNILASHNGSTVGTADTLATIPTVTQLVVGERPGATSPFVGTIHHVLVFPGAYTQAQLNELTRQVSLLSAFRV